MRPSQMARCLVAALAMLVAGPAPTRAGVQDTPLPQFADGKAAILVSTASGVIKNNNLATAFICTNLDAVPVDIGVEVFDETGALRNAIAAGDGAILNVAPGVTVTVATDAMAVLTHSQLLTLNAAGTGANSLRSGAGRLVATSGQVGCVALAVDRLHTIQSPSICPTCRPPSLATLSLSPAAPSPTTTTSSSSTTTSSTSTPSLSTSTSTSTTSTTSTTRPPTTTTSAVSTTSTSVTSTSASPTTSTTQASGPTTTTSSSTTSTTRLSATTTTSPTTSTTTTTLLTMLPPTACPDAQAAAAVEAAIEAQCNCRGAANHGAFVRCAKHVAKASTVPKGCKRAAMDCAARSVCGKPGFVTCCRTTAKGKTTCSTKSSAAHCKATKHGTACVGQRPSCCDACVSGGCAAPSVAHPN